MPLSIMSRNSTGREGGEGGVAVDHPLTWHTQSGMGLEFCPT